MPKGFGYLNLLILKDLCGIEILEKRGVVTFFVSKDKYFMNHYQIDRPQAISI